MKPEEIINDLTEIEAMCDTLKQKAYSTRVKLERIIAPAPSGVKKKKTESDFIKNYRLSLAKRAIKAQSKNK